MGWEEKKVALAWRGIESVSEDESGFEIYLFIYFYGLGLGNFHTLLEQFG